VAAGIVVAVGVVTLATPAGTTLAVVGIHGYQRTLSPLLARAGVQCRFTPTCSRYAEVVIARDGAIRGGLKAAKRFARCGPWTPFGTIDEP
jgi:putative membrane protein insertion efficiency factor